MKELTLKYGCNPNQTPARVLAETGELPFEVLSGRPGYINLLDALNAWQLVKELGAALSLPAAASFKHVSPAGAAVGLPLSDEDIAAFAAENMDGLCDSPTASAYIRARGADRLSSFGDFIALSDECDEVAASFIKRETSDGIIAPAYTAEALRILKTKKNGNYNILRIDRDFAPAPVERKQVFGVTFEQRRNDAQISRELLNNVVTENRELPEGTARDLVLALITLKYTQSNSVCYAFNGQTVGVGAGQQSRIHCTRLAGDKADRWQLRRHPKTLALKFADGLKRAERDNAIDIYLSDASEAALSDGAWKAVFSERPEPLTAEEKQDFLSRVRGVSLASDAFFPFGDNIERAVRSGVQYIAEAGGSVRDDDVIASCNKHNVFMAFTGLRLFHH